MMWGKYYMSYQNDKQDRNCSPTRTVGGTETLVVGHTYNENDCNCDGADLLEGSMHTV